MRSLAEWLVLPLFLLPLLAVAGLGLWARERYRASLDVYRTSGATEATRWLAEPEGPAAWTVQQVLRELGPGGPGRGPAAWRVPFQQGARTGEVLLGAHALGSRPWRLADEYPVGLAPRALADPDVRLQVEVGRHPASLEGVDAATAALADLLGTPDLDRLREAPLPAATKRYVLGRWRLSAPDDPVLADADRLLRALATFQVAGPDRADALPLGAHTLGGVLVLSGGGAWPLLLVPDATRLPQLVLTAHQEDAGTVHLVFAVPAAAAPAAGDVLWQGRLETPLAGTWRFVAGDGGTWWQSPLVRRWRAPVGVLALLLLALPTALLASLFRRRLREEARVRFLNEIAHDLRTPLTSLRLHADLLARGTDDEGKRARHLATVTREAARLSGLLANLLDLARLETGRRRLDLAPVAVREIVEPAIADFAAGRPDRGADVTLEGGADVRVRADPAGLSRALANLLDNAGKFTSAGTPIRVAWRRVGPHVAISVADEGPGIPAAERGRVFRRYERGRDAQARAVPGTGLGLALVADLVAEMRGRVRLVDGDRGATFEIRLPGGSDA